MNLIFLYFMFPLIFSHIGKECEKIFDAYTIENEQIYADEPSWEKEEDSNHNVELCNESNKYSYANANANANVNPNLNVNPNTNPNPNVRQTDITPQSSDLGYASAGQHSDNSYISNVSTEQTFLKMGHPSANPQTFTGYGNYSSYNGQCVNSFQHNTSNFHNRTSWPPPVPPTNVLPPGWTAPPIVGWLDPNHQNHAINPLVSAPSPQWKNSSHSTPENNADNQSQSRESLDSRIQLLLKQQSSKKLDLGVLGKSLLDVEGILQIF